MDLLSLADLVNAKKTQRDKDWPMLRRLVDASYASEREAVGRFQESAARSDRRAVIAAREDADIAPVLASEQEAEMAADRA